MELDNAVRVSVESWPFPVKPAVEFANSSEMPAEDAASPVTRRVGISLDVRTSTYFTCTPLSSPLCHHHHQIAPVLWGILTLLDPADDCSGALYITYRMVENLEEQQDAQQEMNGGGETYGTTQPPRQQPQQQQRGKYIWEYVNDLFTTTSNGNNRTGRQQQQWSTASTSQQGGPNSWKRLGHLMCYDPGVAIYMVVFVVWVVWLPVGISTLVSVDDDEDSCDTVAKYAQGSIICGFAIRVSLAVSCSSR
eukprot:scaffold630_cov174-Amphora_coffeaeformis.AAC.3